MSDRLNAMTEGRVTQLQMATLEHKTLAVMELMEENGQM